VRNWNWKLATAVLVAAVVVYLLATLPPRPVRLSLDGADADLSRRTVTGAYHIHTDRSDGAGTRTEVADAAASAGLKFAIFTDHGDGTRRPDPPEYVAGVLCIDAVEISTNGGHYVALGLPQAPYPLAGEAAAVVEDVRRLGGFGIVAHPDHPRSPLAWSDWSLPVDGLEWINADAEWRTEGTLALTRTVLHYWMRPAPAIAGVLDRPDATMTRWDALNRTRRVVAMAAVDAHGAGGRGEGHPGEPRVAIGPSYEASFRTLTNRVVLDAPFSGDAEADARRLLEAIRSGRVYSVVDALSPDVLVAMTGSQVDVRSPLPDGAEVVERHAGGARRLEIQLPGAPGDPAVPWVLTNWVRTPEPLEIPELAPWADLTEPVTTGEWRVEHSPGSEGDLEAVSGGFTLGYRLQDGERSSQYVAAAADIAGAAFRGLYFEATADRPMRVSVQLRYPPEDRRWVSSVYLDATSRTIFLPIEDLTPADAPAGTEPPEGPPRSILLVIDLVNASPGDTGQLTVRDLQVRR